MEEKGWNILAMIVSGLFSTTGIAGYFFARQERKATLRLNSVKVDLTTAEVVEKIQNMNLVLMKQYEHDKEKQDLKMGQMEQEIKMLTEIIRKQREQCSACPNYIKKPIQGRAHRRKKNR